MLVHLLDALDHLLTSFNNCSIDMGPKKLRDIKRPHWASGRYQSFTVDSISHIKWVKYCQD